MILYCHLTSTLWFYEDTFGVWFWLFYFGVSLRHFVSVLCSTYLHVVILYLDTMCCDDIHDVALAFPPWRGMTDWYQRLGYREVGG